MSSSNEGAHRASGSSDDTPTDHTATTGRVEPVLPRRQSAETDTVVAPAPVVVPEEIVGHREVLSRQKQRFGGIKWGSAFFGWLTATGTALILTALVAAAGTAVGLTATDGNVGQAANQVGQAVTNPATAPTAGLGAAIVILVVVSIAYYCGGYVAGRMARFHGLRQGVAVWLWSIIIAVVVAVLTALAGSRFNILATLNGFPRLPIGEGVLTTSGIIAAIIALAAALVGAVLGGLAGMRYHRRIDRAGYESTDPILPPQVR